MSPNIIAPDIIAALPPAPNTDRFINEAAFGYRYVTPYLKHLPQGAHVLEAGSGPCILLAQLSKDFPSLKFTGIEPVASGFEFYSDSIKAMQRLHKFSLHLCGYEELNTGQKFDIIFLVNVFQHLPDWRHFLGFVKASLAAGGKCLILCPNYGFPYDPHFGIPTLWSKGLTYFFFRKYIANFEASHDRSGLWESLNFVTWSEVKTIIAGSGMEVIFHHSILTDLIDRLDNDLEFAHRQRLLSRIAKFLKWTKLLSLLHLPIFWRIHPYMFLEITNKN